MNVDKIYSKAKEFVAQGQEFCLKNHDNLANVIMGAGLITGAGGMISAFGYDYHPGFYIGLGGFGGFLAGGEYHNNKPKANETIRSWLPQNTPQ